MEKNEENNNFEYILDLQKLETGDENRLIIAGMASSGDLDHDGERVDMDSLHSQFLKYMENPVLRFMHGKDQLNMSAIGKVIPEYTDPTGKVYKTEFRTNGPYIVAELSQADDVASIRKRVTEGVLKGLSIGGRAKRISVWDSTLGKDVNNVIVSRWNETSVVDLPASKTSYFEVLKMACTGPNCPLNDETEPIEEYDPVVDQAVAKFEEIINENTDMKNTLEKLESEIQDLRRANDPNTIEKGEENERTNVNNISTINDEIAEVDNLIGGNNMENEDGIVRLEVPELEAFIEDTVTKMVDTQERVEKLDDYDRLLKETLDMRKRIEELESKVTTQAKSLANQKAPVMKSESEVDDSEAVEKAAKKKKDEEKKVDDEGNEIIDEGMQDKVDKLEAQIEELRASPLYKAEMGGETVEKTEMTEPTGVLGGIISAHYGGK
jgi:hypothetical protein